MSGSLGEQEMLWEHEPTGKCFHSFFELSQAFTSVSITCFLFFFLENNAKKKRKQLVYFYYQEFNFLCMHQYNINSSC